MARQAEAGAFGWAVNDSGLNMKRIHLVGRKNSGKTTLVVELVRHLTALGLRVATVKHTHHGHELDTPGKDSHRHREAGAVAVGILAPNMSAVFRPSKADDSADRYEQFATWMADCDLLLVEGDVNTQAPRIEVWRAVVGVEPIAATDREILAVISDDVVPCPTPVWPRHDVAQIACRLQALVANEENA